MGGDDVLRGYDVIQVKAPERKQFRWPAGWPEDEEEFEALMWGIDNHLHKEGLDVVVRPDNVVFLVGDAFEKRQSFNPQDELADEPGYAGDILIAKARRWYKTVYGDRLIMEWKIGFVPVQLGNTLWRVRIPQAHGPCLYLTDRNLANRGQNGDGKPLRKDSLIATMEKTAEVNCLCLVEDLTQGMATRLSDEQIAEFLEVCRIAIVGLSCLVHLFWMVQYLDGGLFYTVYRDYEASTDSLLNGRYPQSRWDSAQAVEKLLKGLLRVCGVTFPKTHNLFDLEDRLRKHMGTVINEECLEAAAWPAEGRYDEVSTTRNECLCANRAVLKIAKQLHDDNEVTKLLDAARSSWLM
ncbi:MAG: HEPN domain-containing protein [Acidobacteriaceae bacterium]